MNGEQLAQAIADSCTLTADLAALLLSRHDSDAVRVTSTNYVAVATALAARGIDATSLPDREVMWLMSEVADVLDMAASRIKAESN